MPDSRLSADVLGKLLVALQTLDILPDVEGMAAFLQPALGEVPGITSAFMCLDGEILPADRAEIATLHLHCPRSVGPVASAPPCLLEDRPDIHLVNMRTPRRAFGCLQLVVNDDAQFEAYKPFLVNIGHMVATILENRENDQSLAAANAELNRLVNQLEDRVKDRTRELEAAEERYRTTLATLPDAISALRAVRGETGEIVDFEWTYANPAEAALHPETKLVGTRLLDIHPQYRVLGLFDALCGVVKNGEQSIMEVQGTHGPLGAEFAECRTSRLDDGVVVAMQDVTDRHVAAQMLAESEDRYRLLAENASDVVMLLTPSWSFEWVSGSVADVLGWQAPDLVGLRIEEFIHADDLDRFRLEVADAAPGSAASVEFRFRRSDETYHWVAGRTRVKVDDDGTPVAVVGGLVDIADRKATEAREQERLRELEHFQRLTVGRELKMIELKKQIEHLKKHGSTNRSERRDQDDAPEFGPFA
jgi:PAS domain S-box-containing protein